MLTKFYLILIKNKKLTEKNTCLRNKNINLDRKQKSLYKILKKMIKGDHFLRIFIPKKQIKIFKRKKISKLKLKLTIKIRMISEKNLTNTKIEQISFKHHKAKDFSKVTHIVLSSLGKIVPNIMKNNIL